MKFWIFVIFIETFLEQSIWICKWVSWWCHRLTISNGILFTEMTNTIFQLWESKTCFTSPLNKCRIMFGLIYISIWGHAFKCLSNKNKKIIYNIHGKLWGDEIINSLIFIFMFTFQEMFCWKFKISYFLYFFSFDLHQIFTVLFEMLYSFYILN